jgi:hypothetical protein
VGGGGRGIRVRRLGGDRAGEIRLTRFLRNRAVTLLEMVETAREKTAPRTCGRHVLAIQDTSVVRSEGGGGDYLHAMIGVDAETGSLLGLIDASVMARSAGERSARRDRPIDEKQSYRWLEGMRHAAQVCAPADRITMIADRESDIYEVLACRPDTVDLIVRVAHNRRTLDDGLIFDVSPEALHHVDLSLPAAPGRKARTARMSVRYCPVRIKRPSTKKRSVPAHTDTLYLVDVREENPPEGTTPVHWRLLTSHEVTGIEDALGIVAFYRRRWQIEELFRTMKKKGFDIEGVLVADAAPFRKLVMATLLAAITIRQLVHARDGAPPDSPDDTPLRPALDAFDPDDLNLLAAFTKQLEGKTERQKNPHPPDSLAFAAWVCARLGGWNCYYGKPGPIVMLNGWIIFQNAKTGAQLAAQHDV